MEWRTSSIYLQIGVCHIWTDQSPKDKWQFGRRTLSFQGDGAAPVPLVVVVLWERMEMSVCRNEVNGGKKKWRRSFHLNGVRSAQHRVQNAFHLWEIFFVFAWYVVISVLIYFGEKKPVGCATLCTSGAKVRCEDVRHSGLVVCPLWMGEGRWRMTCLSSIHRANLRKKKRK